MIEAKRKEIKLKNNLSLRTKTIYAKLVLL